MCEALGLIPAPKKKRQKKIFLMKNRYSVCGGGTLWEGEGE
jgi:hypothetical protein